MTVGDRCFPSFSRPALWFGDPASYVDRVHAAGSTLLSQVQTVEAARRSAEVGVDVIIAQGNDAGGHAGEIPLLPLLPQVVDVAGTVPVLAAGGIGDGRGLSAVLMLGAQGAAMGTRVSCVGRGRERLVATARTGTRRIGRRLGVDNDDRHRAGLGRSY